jgi:hypothetical protein
MTPSLILATVVLDYNRNLKNWQLVLRFFLTLDWLHPRLARVRINPVRKRQNPQPVVVATQG